MSTSKRIEGLVLIREWPDQSGMLTFWCPGCSGGHTITFGGSETWQWNGSTSAPTFSPSVLANGFRGASSDEWNRKHPRCHSFVTDGRIQYLADCEHELAGQTVDMVPLPARYSKFLDA